MKKYKFISCLLLCILALQSCLFEDDLVFTNSAAERLTNAIKDETDSLQTASNGWIMQYFATEQSGGYNLLVKFNKYGQAIIAGKSELTQNIYTTDTCHYEMIGDTGPVLTFNTYSKVLHAFSVPDNSGLGLEGDFEFIVTKVTANQIILKGKKRGTTILLTKLPQTISWQKYLSDLETMDLLMLSKNPPSLTLNYANSIYSFTYNNNHTFTIQKVGSSTNIPVIAAFVITTSGIRFQTIQEIEGQKFQTMDLSTDKSSLISEENPEFKLIAIEDLAAYLNESTKIWELNPSELSPNIKTIYDQILQSCVTKYSASNVKLILKYYLTRKSFELTLTFSGTKTKYEGNLDLLLTTNTKNALSISYKGTADSNGKSFYNNVAGLKDIVNIICSDYLLNTDIAINPRNIKFTKSQDSNTWFTVICQ